MPLKHPNMFVTVACVRAAAVQMSMRRRRASSDLACARAGAVEEVTTPQLAVGMFADATFTSAHVECRSGDLLALLTDGLIEVFDSASRELGFEWAKTTLGAVADRPLSENAERLLAGARSHGVQLDDQTVLLIRRGTVTTPGGRLAGQGGTARPARQDAPGWNLQRAKPERSAFRS